MDLSKLTPAPWPSVWLLEVHQEGHVHRGVFSEADDEFARVAHAAFDVMLRRRWHVVPSEMVASVQGKWVVLAPHQDFKYSYHADPFTALVEADRWYAENVEKKQQAL